MYNLVNFLIDHGTLSDSAIKLGFFRKSFCFLDSSEKIFYNNIYCCSNNIWFLIYLN